MSSKNNQLQSLTSPPGTYSSGTKNKVAKITKKSRPKDANYKQKLIDNGVYPYRYKPNGNIPPLPPNWEEINRRLTQRRPSLSSSRFPNDDYQKFIDADAETCNVKEDEVREDEVKDSVIPAMLRVMGSLPSGTKKNILFTNIDPMAAGISQAKPDYYDGAQPEQIHPEVRAELSNHIIPSNHAHLPAVPNFVLETKGPSGSWFEASQQACHNGAIGARAMQSLRTYRQDEPVCGNNIHSISSIYHCGTLKMYGHSVAQPKGPETRQEYYMHQLGAWAMTGSTNNFNEGATAFKNASDIAKEYRDSAIARVNEIAAQNSQAEDDDNKDKDEGDVEEDVDEGGVEEDVDEGDVEEDTDEGDVEEDADEGDVEGDADEGDVEGDMIV